MDDSEGVYGLMAEFRDEHQWVEAIRRARKAGYRRMDGYSPFPVEEAAEALEFRRTWIPQATFMGGVTGLVVGLLLQVYAAAVHYPLNVGGRPLVSWPYFVPITYELTILVASFTALLGMLLLNRLPEPYHPVFNVPEFARASQDRFFLLVEAKDPRFNYDQTKRFLQGLAADEVHDVAS